mmetsp:Transcript_27529/g.51166  ORF Transcript_27529/g.51166 Transcript_27529/m.51166 type:complete len:96 (-) Transcript_27529:699-986(-)
MHNSPNRCMLFNYCVLSWPKNTAPAHPWFKNVYAQAWIKTYEYVPSWGSGKRASPNLVFGSFCLHSQKITEITVVSGARMELEHIQRCIEHSLIT